MALCITRRLAAEYVMIFVTLTLIKSWTILYLVLRLERCLIAAF